MKNYKIEIDLEMETSLYDRLVIYASCKNLSPEAAVEQLIEDYIEQFCKNHIIPKQQFH